LRGGWEEARREDRATGNRDGPPGRVGDQPVDVARVATARGRRTRRQAGQSPRAGGADGNQPRGYRCRGGARRRRQLREATGSQDGRAAIAKAKGTQPLTVCEIEIGIDASLSF